MSSAKLAAVASLAAISLAGCGAIHVKPAAQTGSSAAVSRGRVNDPRTSPSDHIQCLRQKHLEVRKVGTTGLQIGAAPYGPYVRFSPTPGAAQANQIAGRDTGAEVIGSALVFPQRASDQMLKEVEDCIAHGVSG